ncbi:MAG TPA: dihydrolipoamide acetyltransferase [Myxococcota bacterium]|nr:dihydrolipoamide acetyltransferase [Myxococcota bacterium]HRY95022.1 dihydrolipoamide acetyltransferase [Myxococcota bacterium]HSA23566.1 dihydrolipoamide acetyltransferase [Myxococcota bacterium]
MAKVSVLMRWASLCALGCVALGAGLAWGQEEGAGAEPAAGGETAADPAAGTPAPAPAPGEPAAAVPAPDDGPAAAAPGTADDAYELKLRGLEERVNELKEKIFRTKARIMQLQETVVNKSIGAGTRAVLVHVNEMGGAFKLASVQYALDTQPVFKKVDVEGDLDGLKEKEIFNSNLVPGNHNIAVQMVFQGQGFGFFSYVKGYKFKVTSSYTFSAEEGKIITVRIVAFERGGITTKLEERPAVRYDIEIEKLTPERAKTLQEKTEETAGGEDKE